MIKKKIIFIAILFFVLGVFLVKAIEIPEKNTLSSSNLSQCRTNLQPSGLFTKEVSTLPYGYTNNSFSISYSNSYQDHIDLYFSDKNKFIITPVSKFEGCCGSMRPTLGDRSLAIEQINPPEEDLHIGDIITFKCPKQNIRHRIIEFRYIDNKKYFLTKGDNNEYDDLENFNCLVSIENVTEKIIGVLY